ncbi:hypothetical protein GGX14DRAFT_637584 [Mycena pura]|uniref:Uncharacterized protein n=1 Tax=Mycena pura TaxID=153505 RepID=A0AAD6VDI3_9AGAR|nr:hypothetical protein GGX14DRAFT_637584 [Mycena pura]
MPSNNIVNLDREDVLKIFLTKSFLQHFVDDEIGLVRAISVKACSSPEFVQDHPVTPHDRLSRDYKANGYEGVLHTQCLIGLGLQYAEESQHRFSSDPKSTLDLAFPALEILHADWTKCAADPLNTGSNFVAPLKQALKNVHGYYQKTTNSNSNSLHSNFRTSERTGQLRFRSLQLKIWRKVSNSATYMKLYATSSAAPIIAARYPVWASLARDYVCCCDVVIGIQRARIFLGWNHNQQETQPVEG